MGMSGATQVERSKPYRGIIGSMFDLRRPTLGECMAGGVLLTAILAGANTAREHLRAEQLARQVAILQAKITLAPSVYCNSVNHARRLRGQIPLSLEECTRMWEANLAEIIRSK